MHSESPANPSKEYLEGLPLRKVMLAGEVRSVRYDEETKTIFLIDSNGNYSGRSATMELPNKETGTPNEDPDEPKLAQPMNLEYEPDSDENEGDEEEPEKPIFQIPRKWLIYGGIGLGALILYFILHAAILVAIQTPKETDPTDAPETTANATIQTTQVPTTEAPTTPPPPTTIPATTAPPPTEETQPKEATVQILTAARPILPGEVIKDNCLNAIEIPESEYRSLSLQAGVFLQEDKKLVLGYKANKYIPLGVVLSYNMLSKEYEPVNLWRQNEDASLLTLPIEINPGALQDVLWGCVTDIKIVVQTKTTNTESPEATETPEGVDHQSTSVESMVIDTYTVEAVQIVDLLDNKGNSLYSTYAVLSDIPAVFRSEEVHKKYDTKDKLESILPSFLLIKVTPAQMPLLAALDTKSMEVSVTNSIPVWETSAQEDTWNRLADLTATLNGVWKNLP